MVDSRRGSMMIPQILSRQTDPFVELLLSLLGILLYYIVISQSRS